MAGLLGAIAEFEQSRLRERVVAGWLERAGTENDWDARLGT
jgi:hypothetical protein